MEKGVTLSGKEQKRLMVMNELLAGRLTGAEAAEVLGVTLRQTRRLLAAYRQGGAAAMAHGNRGRSPVNRVAAEVVMAVIQLAKGEYRDYNDTHFTEELSERHGIPLSVSTVRRIRRGQGLASPRKRRPPRHRRRRQRYPQAGMLLQVDGSKHDWLEGRGPWLTLHAAIDDATNEVPWAIFREEEDATGYALLVHHISQTHGLPLALYGDRHTILQSPREATLAEQLEGLEPQTQVGRLLERLDIQLIAARSPQAKGRVERLFGTLQDRLVKELRRAQATTLEEANRVLHRFLPRFNEKFMKAPARPGSAYRPKFSLSEANERIYFTYQRVVANDHTISLFGHTLALPPLAVRTNLASRRVELRHRMDGRLAVAYQGQVLGLLEPALLEPPRLEQFEPAPKHAAPSPPNPAPPTPTAISSSANDTTRGRHKPTHDHPWRRQGRAAFEQRKQQQQSG